MRKLGITGIRLKKMNKAVKRFNKTSDYPIKPFKCDYCEGRGYTSKGICKGCRGRGIYRVRME